MNYRRWILTLAFIALTVILLEEFAYFAWRQANRGEHWSHLTEKTGLQNWNEALIEVDPNELNRSWSGRF